MIYLFRYTYKSKIDMFIFFNYKNITLEVDIATDIDLQGFGFRERFCLLLFLNGFTMYYDFFPPNIWKFMSVILIFFGGC
jgi:hypothetical protein